MKINFVEKKYIYLAISIVLCLLSILIIAKKNLSLGLEFCGGTEIEIEITNDFKLDDVKKYLLKIKNIKLNYYGSNQNIQIKIKNSKNNIDDIKNILNLTIGKDNFKIINSTYIGSEINKETINKSFSAIILAILSMTLYLILRFNIIFGLSAIFALFHDIIIILGIISLMNIELNLIIISAIFTIFGYSINDTIIIFDRIRENIKYNKDLSLETIINNSINKTLSRTIGTSFSTILVTLTLIFFSSESLFLFSLILTLGIIIGTYSSIFISAIIIIFIKKSKKKESLDSLKISVKN